jgi:DNA (cytosine-5)-methyltransferase 1
VTERRFSSLELCSGSGAQALGLERAGFDPVMLIDDQELACETVRLNRPDWDVRCMDLLGFDPLEHPQTLDIDLVSGGLPRVKSSASVRRKDDDVERRLLMAAVSVLIAVRPKVLLLENVPDLVLSPKLTDARQEIEQALLHEGYVLRAQVLDAVDFGVPQFRKQGFLVALQRPYDPYFRWPSPQFGAARTVGEVLGPSMAGNYWPGAVAWARRADRPGPALVGGSDKRGGADLGPSGSKRAWAKLGVNGGSVADDVPDAQFPTDGSPKITVRQAAMLQAIPADWRIAGAKTRAYRQIGNASPPPVAEAIGRAVGAALRAAP